MQTSEVLHKAADLLQERGWTQGSHVSPDGFCAMGAIREVCGADEDDFIAEGADWWHAGMMLANHVGGAVAVWNDRGHRVAAEVVEALRACAAIEAAKEDTLAAEFIALLASPA